MFRIEMPDFEEMMKTVKAVHVVRDAVKDINDPVLFASFIGTVVDEWTECHGMSSDEAEEIIVRIMNVMPSVHALVGTDETDEGVDVEVVELAEKMQDEKTEEEVN